MTTTIKDFVEQRVELNHLPINIDECVSVIEKYTDIYPGVSEIKRFFHYVHNQVGGILNRVNPEFTELFGNLVIRGKTDITYYLFVFDEDYLEWLRLRVQLYSELTNPDDIRLLNYVELSTMNMITDLTSTDKYELISFDGIITTFNKTAYGTDQDGKSFIKFLGGKFKEGYSFKPIK